MNARYPRKLKPSKNAPNIRQHQKRRPLAPLAIDHNILAIREVVKPAELPGKLKLFFLQSLLLI